MWGPWQSVPHHGVSSYLRAECPGARQLCPACAQWAWAAGAGPLKKKARHTPLGWGGASPGAKIQLNLRNQWVCPGSLSGGVRLERLRFHREHKTASGAKTKPKWAPASCACMCVCVRIGCMCESVYVCVRVCSCMCVYTSGACVCQCVCMCACVCSYMCVGG